jgi:hypothetical protein
LKRFLVLFLLTVFAFNNLGYYLVFKVLQFQLREKMEQQIKKELPDVQLHVVKINKKDRVQPQWSWFESDKEFSFRGIMYDVVRIKTTPDVNFYYCITDTEESGLSDKLDQLIQDDTSHSKKTNQLEKSNNKLFFINTYASFTTEKIVPKKGTIIYMVKDAFQSAALDIPVPPPWLV